jgi:hypothetical protein
MKRCDKAGVKRCEFAAGSPLRRFETITKRLKAKPLSISLPPLGTLRETYADFIGEVLSALYIPTAGDDVTMLAQEMWILTSPTSSKAQLTKARATYAERIRARRAARAFPYDNSFEAFASVLCTDGRHPADASNWPSKVARADRDAPYFGRAWAWGSAQCARNTWTAKDEDAYTGPFDRRTRKTVLVVGSYWDPATNYHDAVKSSRLLPNSRLLSSNNWGHTAYGTSDCATGAIDTYLLKKKLPPVGKVCVGEDQPFTTGIKLLEKATGPDLRTASISEIAAAGLPAAGAVKQLPPVTRRF